MKRMRWLPIVLAVPLALAGCSAAVGTSDPSAAGAKPDINIQIVTHGSPGDTFWDVVKSGAMQAGKDLGVTVTYQSDGDASKQSQLIDAAIATKPDGLVVSMANPDGVQDAIKRAVAAGIPVIVTNKGDSRWQEVGAETYVGQSELVAGQEVGKRLKTAGLKNVLCVIQEVGNTGLQDRCKGVAQELGGVTTNIQVDGANVADAQNVIKSALLADPSIDGVVTLNSPISPAASQAIKEASSSAKLAGFELSTDVLTMIEKGDMLFAVDQQPYLQGYLPVTFLTDQVRNGDVVGGGQPVYTGPGFVTADNAAQIATFAKNGTR
ncbi:MAG: Simple sugar transport system substrate-binding protein [Rhodoglobus sp.]|nr:Simple sugar transport system substrate-binding protein [Rhodoglobus sp.]